MLSYKRLVRRSVIEDSIHVDRESRNETNIRMMTFQRDTPGWCCKDRLLDRSKRITQDALTDTSRMEKENRSGCPADQEDQDKLTDKSNRIGVVRAGCNSLWMNRSGDHRKSFHG